jgi:hypothetical protein
MFPEGYDCPPESVFRAGGGRGVAEADWDETLGRCVVNEMHFQDDSQEASVDEDRLAGSPEYTKERRLASVWVSQTALAIACGESASHPGCKACYRYDPVDDNPAHGVIYFDFSQSAAYQAGPEKQKKKTRRAMREHVAAASTICLHDYPEDERCGQVVRRPATDPES